MAGFTVIENTLLDDKELTIQEQMLLIVLISYYNEEKGYAFPSYKQIKLRSKLGDNRTLIKAMDSLIKKGYIRKETKKGVGNKYFINSKIRHNGELHLVENYTKCKSTPTPSGELHNNLVENYTTTSTNANTNKKTIYISLDFIDDVIDKVKITQDEYDKLLKKFGVNILHKNIIALDNYITNGRGNKYKDHYRALNAWCSRANIKKDKDEQANNSWAGVKQFN
jgi:hypothetical protein